MTILIDTQVLIWFLNGDKQLGAYAKELLENADNRVCISYFSLFEITFKASLGKLIVDSDYVDSLPKVGIDILYPKTTELKEYQVYSSDNKDPFDNMLIACSIVNNCSFMTSDQSILSVLHKDFELISASK